MYEILTTSNITFGVGMIAVIFSVYLYFRTPQENLDKRQALSEKEIDGKANLLAEQVKWEREATDKKFTEMGTHIASAMTTAQNHIHTVDTKVDKLQGVIEDMGKNIVKLSTIIEERIPRK